MLWVWCHKFEGIQARVAKLEFKQHVVFKSCNISDEQVSVLT